MAGLADIPLDQLRRLLAYAAQGQAAPVTVTPAASVPRGTSAAVPLGSLGQPRVPAPLPQAIPDMAPAMQEPGTPEMAAPSPVNARPSWLQRLGSGLGERLLPTDQLTSAGLTPEQAQAAQTAARWRFGMGLLGSIGNGEAFGPNLGRAFNAGTGTMGEVLTAQAAGERKAARAEENAWRKERAQVEDAQFKAQLEQRATLAQQQIAAEAANTQARIEGSIKAAQVPSATDRMKLGELQRRYQIIDSLKGKPYEKFTEQEKGLWNWALQSAPSDLMRAQQGGGLGGLIDPATFAGGAGAAPSTNPLIGNRLGY